MDENAVSFDGVPAEVVLSLNGTDLFVTVPDAAASGPVTVQTNGHTSNPLPFVVDDALAPRAITDEDVAAGFMLGEIMIAYRSNRLSPLEVEALNADYGFVAQEGHPSTGGFYLAYLPQGASAAETLHTVDQLMSDSRVLLATPHRLVEPAQSPSEMEDPELGGQNHLHLTNLHLGLHTIFPHRGENASIGVIDSGIDPLLGMMGELDVRYYFAAVQKRVSLDSGVNFHPHGTQVGTVAAAQSNTILGAGVAPKASVISVRVCPEGKGAASTADLVSGIWLSAYLRLDVVNVSMGSSFAFTGEGLDSYRQWKLSSRRLFDRIHEDLRARGLRMPVFVYAASNDRDDPLLLHGTNSDCGPRTLCVGAVDIAGYASSTLASSSSSRTRSSC